MKPADHITPPDWMTSPATQRLLRVLQDYQDAQRKTALFVGGCVRNAVLGRPVSDIDIATLWTPEEVMQRLKEAGIRAIPTGIDHGTITALIDQQHFEITTLRRDVATDGRRAVVAFTTDWAEDAARRDFTMNTLLADGQGHIYDSCGQGLNDARAGRVIFVGDPAARIAEDYLRILRFFRFHALYGTGPADSAALEACRASVPGMEKLSRERITQEMLKILAVENPAPTLALMFAHNVALFLRGQAYDEDYFAGFCALQQQSEQVDIIARLAALCGFDAQLPAAHLALSQAQLKFIRTLSALVKENETLTAPQVRDLVYLHGASLTTQLVLWTLARQHADIKNAEAATLLHTAQTFSPPKFPLTGDDVMKLGIKPGVLLGQLLSDVETWWRAQDFAPDYQQCLTQLTQRAQAARSGHH